MYNRPTQPSISRLYTMYYICYMPLGKAFFRDDYLYFVHTDNYCNVNHFKSLFCTLYLVSIHDQVKPLLVRKLIHDSDLLGT